MDIKWKKLATHNGTRISWRAYSGRRIVAQISLEHLYTVFQPATGKWNAHFRTPRAAKSAVERALENRKETNL